MPMFDRLCEACSRQIIDCMEPVTPPDVPCPDCGGVTRRAWFGKPANVIGDEIDVSIQNGICNPDGTPRRFTSRTELREAERKSGYANYVVHRGTNGGDKSPHTSRWV